MSTLKNLSHDQLLTRLHALIERDQGLEAELVAHLGEVDARRLYLEQACPSMFHYCVQVLRFAEGVAYKRIAVARAARRFPELLAALRTGDLHLTAACLLAPHLDRGCVAEWLAAANHKTAQEIKQWIADRKPKADVKTSLRNAPAARSIAGASRPIAATGAAPTGSAQPSDTASPHAAPAAEPAAARFCDSNPVDAVAAAPAVLREAAEKGKASSLPLGAGRYFVRFTIDAVVHEELQELRSLLRHQIPGGDVAKIIGRAVHSLLEQARKQKRGARLCARSARSPEASTRPGSGSSPTAGADAAISAVAPGNRHSRKVPVAIRRAVWERDEGQCSYVSRAGRQCGTRDFLEFHHELPWARRREHRASNIHLRCRAHNQHAAELDFGVEHMAEYRKRRPSLSVNETGAERATDSGPQLDLNPVAAGVADL